MISTGRQSLTLNFFIILEFKKPFVNLTFRIPDDSFDFWILLLILSLFNEFVDSVLDSFLGLHNLLYEHFRLIFRIISLSDDTVILGVVYAFDTPADELLLFISEGLLLCLVLFNFLLENFGDSLISRWEKVIGEEYFLAVG